MASAEYFPKEVWKLAINISISSLIFCFGLVSMNSCTENISEVLGWGSCPLYLSIFTTLYPLGVMIGCLLGSPLSDRIGARRTILVCNKVFILSSTISIIPTNPSFRAGRLVSGIVGGVFIAVHAVFINEITPDPMTGPVGTLIQQACGIAFVLAYFLGLFVPTDNIKGNSWNYFWMFIIFFPAFVSIYQIYYFSVVFKFENPRWLIQNGREDEARRALRIVYKESSIETGMNRLSQSGEGKEEYLLEKNPSIKDMLCNKTYRKMMRNSLALNIGQQTIGNDIVLIYSTKMFESMGGGKFFARVMTFILGITCLISGLIAIYVLKKAGRKTILVYGTLAITFTLLLLGLFNGVFEGGAVFGSILVFVYIFFSILSMGSVFWTYLGEVCNDKAISIGIAAAFMFMITLSFAFPFAEYYLGISYCFFILCGLSLILFVYITIDIIETNGLSKQEINQKILNK